MEIEDKKIMNIICATDRNFLYPAYVTMWSVIKNHTDIKVCFYLLIANDIEQEELDKLSRFIESTGNSIFYVRDDGLYDDNKFTFSQKFTKAAFFRLMAHKYLPNTADRALYLDVDIIVDKNIYEDFYMTDFKGNYLVVASHNPDPSSLNTLTESTINLQSAAKGSYFNSGVLLMNIALFKKNIDMNSYDNAFKECEQKGLRIFYDQGLFNYMFGAKSIYVSSMDYNYRHSIPIDHASRLDKNRVYKQAIIHYTGYRQYYKPWDLFFNDEEVAKFGNVPFKDNYFYVSKETERLSAIWWDYASHTPVYDKLYYEMNIKKKWFIRILMPLMIYHNKLMKDNENNVNTINKLNSEAVKKDEQIKDLQNKAEVKPQDKVSQNEVFLQIQIESLKKNINSFEKQLEDEKERYNELLNKYLSLAEDLSLCQKQSVETSKKITEFLLKD